ncbi:unnamed protein product [Citrullus colocynthis]|uniref:Uncharacterized protein n=1 Tax=Citrullus colocynthis TaxID=252529 RepID=A0ABP0YL29_9ROSI
MDGRSTSVMICGMLPWNGGTRNLWRISPPLLIVNFFSRPASPGNDCKLLIWMCECEFSGATAMEELLSEISPQVLSSLKEFRFRACDNWPKRSGTWWQLFRVIAGGFPNHNGNGRKERLRLSMNFWNVFLYFMRLETTGKPT